MRKVKAYSVLAGWAAMGAVVAAFAFGPVESPLPACQVEDSTGCVWDAVVQGNGDGVSVVR